MRSFLHLSAQYFDATGDLNVFVTDLWVDAVEVVLDTFTYVYWFVCRVFFITSQLEATARLVSLPTYPTLLVARDKVHHAIEVL